VAETSRPGRQTLRSALAVVVAVVAVVGCSSKKPTRPDIAAHVGEATVPSKDVEALASRYIRVGSVDEQHPAIPVKDGRRIVLNFLIKFALLNDLSSRASIAPVETAAIDAAIAALAPEELTKANLEPGDVRLSIEAGEISKRLAAKQFPNIAVSDFELKELFDKASARYAAGWTAKVRVAYFPTKDSAEQLRAKSPAAGAFETTATAFGATKAASMGAVSKGDALGEPVLKALESLPAGQLSEPLQAEGGWLVFLIDSRDDVAAKSFDEARPELLEELQDQKRQKLFVEWFDEQLKQAKVDVHKFYGAWESDRATVGE
jgi:hypothetical protein